MLFRALVTAATPCTTCSSPARALSQELTGLVRQSRADLKPALAHLEDVVAVLNKNADNLDRASG